MIKAILWDIDGTILDFKEAEYYGMKNCFTHFGLGECTDQMIATYAAINDKYWEMLERKEVTRQELFTARFKEFFDGEGIVFDKLVEFNKEYQHQLSTLIFFRDNGYELIKELKGQIKQYAVTNGSYNVQKHKLEKSGLKELFEDCFISDQIGVEKPNVEFFDHVKKAIGPMEDDEIIIVGDSLTSDMKGGNNAGISCCWYNPFEKKDVKGLKIDYEIRNLWEIKEIVFGNHDEDN
jgi:YjjG family noncanonical pyrimidine nucleotidase